MSFRIVLIVILCLSSITAVCASDRTAALEELYTRSGLETQASQLPYLLQSEFKKQKTTNKNLQAMPQRALAPILARIASDFSATEMKRVIVRVMDDVLSDEEIARNLEWLTSPSGMKFTALEEAVSTPEGMMQMQSYIRQIQNNPPPASRVDLTQELDKAMQATESYVQMLRNMQIAMASAINSTQPENKQLPFNQISKLVNENTTLNIEQIKYSTFVTFLYVYKDLSDIEIQEYIDFMKTPAGSQFMVAVIKGMKQALFDGGDRWGQSMADILTKVAKEHDG